MALKWLKKHNDLCKGIKIDESRLDSIEDCDDISKLVASDDVVTKEDEALNINTDLGLNREETIAQMKSNEAESLGFQNLDDPIETSKDDRQILKELQESISKSPAKRHMTICWPKTSEVPVSEYSSKKLFAMAYPWLFPGGVGDVTDFPTDDIGKWGEMLFRHKDGRFQNDKFFCFYALNYITRHRNASSGSWFVREFSKGCPENLEDLKSQIEAGNTSFINRITHCNQNIKGSTPYWHKKRSELYNWINYHVQEGNGPPMFFITLSCAEHHWPDIIALVKERMEIAGENSDMCHVGSPKLSSILNAHTLVVQEHFQKRVNLWLKTVGRIVFGIKHHWGRFEFAPGRGQIHVHLLAISSDNSIHE